MVNPILGERSQKLPGTAGFIYSKTDNQSLDSLFWMMIVGRGVAGFGAGGEYPGVPPKVVLERDLLSNLSLRD